LIFLPMESGLTNVDQQRAIGQLTQAVINSVPPEQRKGYLLQPQQFFTMQSLLDYILQADGVTPDMIRAQQTRLDLLQRLAEAQDDAAFEAIVKQNDAQIDQAFLQLVSVALISAQAENRPEDFARLAATRSRLLDLSRVGQQVKAQAEALAAFTAHPTRENLLEQLVKAPDADTRETLLGIGRALLDYPFFQELTGQIDAARAGGKTAEANRLAELRKEILTVRDDLDAQAQAAIERRAATLRELMLSENLEPAARQHADALDDLFLGVLSAEMQAAQQAGDNRAYERLRQVASAALNVIQEGQPPEVRFLNALLSVQYPDQTRALLERNRQALDPEFLHWLGTIVVELREDGRGESAAHLTQVIAQARELMSAPAAA